MIIKEYWDPSVNAALSASAGSGKTYNLTTRLIVILLKEIESDLRSIFAVTFTNKATLEMKEKLLKRLRGLADLDRMSAGDEKNEKIDELAALLTGGDRGELKKLSLKAYEKLLTGLSDLNISTIHSFLSGIVSLFPFEIGIDPETSVIDETEAKYIQKLALDEFFERAKSDEEHSKNIMDAYFELYAGSFDVRSVISENMLEFLKKSCEIDNSFRLDELKEKLALERERFKKHEARFINIMNENLEGICRAVRECSEQNDRVRSSAKRFETFLRRPNVKRFFKHVAEFLLEKETLSDNSFFKSFIRKTGGTNSAPAIQMETCYANIQNYFRNEFPPVAESYNRVISLAALSLFLEYLNIYSTMKKREGCLDFSDLESHALSLLSGEAFDKDYFYYRIDTRIKHLLIDEFQDTNIIQWKVLCPLVEEIVSGYGVHDSPGSFFYVGDVKQAIYRFRGGESGLFSSVMEEIKGIKGFALGENWRSGRIIVDFVNDLFLKLMNKDGYVRQEAVLEGGYVEVDAIKEGEDSDGTTCMRTAEIVKSLVDKGLDFSDIAVLGRTKKHLTMIEDEFKKSKIPYRSETSSRLSASVEVGDIVNLLRFFNDPEDDIALASALKSPLFRISNNELKTASFHPGKTLYLKMRNSRACGKLEKLSGLLPKAGYLTPLSFINRIYTEFSVPYVYADIPGAQENLFRFLEEIHIFQKEHNGDLSCLLQYIERRDEALMQESAEGEGEGKVNILTVHKSKGLEFHTVIIPFADDEIALSVTKTPFIFVNDRDFSLKEIVKTPTLNEMGISERLRKVFDEESVKVIRDELNLLYVALTRAKRNLYVIGSVKSWSRDTRNRKKGELKDTWQNWIVRELGNGGDEKTGGKEGYVPVISRGSEYLESEEKIRRAKRGRKQAPPYLRFPASSEYGQEKDISPSKDEEEVHEQDEYLFFERRRRQAMGKGIHLALSRIGLLTHDCDTEKIIKDAVKFAERGNMELDRHPGLYANELSHEMSENIKDILLDKELEHLFFAFPDRSVKLEAPVYSRSKSGEFVGGIIDRVVVEPREIKVIDYKWTKSSWSGEEIEDIAGRYRKQLGYYRESLRMIYGDKRKILSYLLLIGAPPGKRLIEV